MMNEALEGQPFFLENHPELERFYSTFNLERLQAARTFENQLISQRQLYFWETSCISEEFRLHLRWWMKNIYKHFNKVFNIISKMCAELMEYRSLLANTTSSTPLTLKVCRSSCWM